jgi:hypothetical protein
MYGLVEQSKTFKANCMYGLVLGNRAEQNIQAIENMEVG